MKNRYLQKLFWQMSWTLMRCRMTWIRGNRNWPKYWWRFASLCPTQQIHWWHHNLVCPLSPSSEIPPPCKWIGKARQRIRIPTGSEASAIWNYRYKLKIISQFLRGRDTNNAENIFNIANFVSKLLALKHNMMLPTQQKYEVMRCNTCSSDSAEAGFVTAQSRIK